MKEQMFYCTVEDKTAVLTFDVPGAPVNTWSNAGMESFMQVVEDIRHRAASGEVTGAVILSGKDDTFLTGADLNDLVRASESAEKCLADITAFQDCFNALAGLPVPSVAAVWGHCLGGGLEFALAATARIAKKAKTTQFGLPELGVGVFPAGGGTSRLARLIGYPAIDMVLNSENVDAARALELGIVDRLVPEDADLKAEAKEFLRAVTDGTVNLNRPMHDFSGSADVIAEARRGVIKKARGRRLPAPMAYLDVLEKGLTLPLEQSMQLEREYYVKVATSPETKGFINTFFISNYNARAAKFITRGYQPKPVKKAAVLGFGTMGRGIAIDILNRARIPVVVKDTPEALAAGKAFVEKIFQGMADRGRLRGSVADLMSLIIPVTDYTSEFADVDIVIEAVFEDIEVKKQVYDELCGAVRDDCLIASNTSYLSVNELADMVKCPGRFVGMHFFSPVWRMPLVEVVKSNQTTVQAVDDLLGFVGALRKRPVICSDGPGFVVNAVLDPFMTSCMGYVEEGNPIEKVDAAMVDFGMPVGPIRLMDEVGIDVSHHIYKSRGIEQKTVEAMYNAGRYGAKKNGKGFFGEDGEVAPEVAGLIAKRPKRLRSAEEIQSGILTEMVTIGKRLLDTGVVDDVRMIDAGMIFGTGYPADKGGPMKWADITGLSQKLFGQNIYH